MTSTPQSLGLSIPASSELPILGLFVCFALLNKMLLKLCLAIEFLPLRR